MPLLDDFPFPFNEPAGQELWRTLANLNPVPLDAMALAERFAVDPLDLPPGLTPRQLWHVILEKTAIKGTTRVLTADVLAQNPRSPKADFLRKLVNDQPVVVSPEPMEGFDPTVTAPEALLFSDDLTMPVGLVPNLVATLQCLHARAAAVCLFTVENAFGEFSGTGFRIGPDLILTNEHVLFPKLAKATSVRVDFGFDVDTGGKSLPVVPLVGDPATIVADRDDDWGVIRVAGMDGAIPVISLAGAPVPKDGDRAFIVQHPDGKQRRVGFVRNIITAVTDEHVQYLTDTQPGSSGAPVFDAQCKPIALHHRGGTPTQKTGKAPLTKNQGVRISRVHAALVAQGLIA
jgi:hypothetical protein